MPNFLARLLPALLLALVAFSAPAPSAAAEEPSDGMERYLALLETIRGKLDQTLALYESGEVGEAFQMARSAYLDHFELVEFPLRDRDPDLTLELEDAFARLRTDIEARVPLDVVTDDLARLQAGMDDVERTLAPGGYAPFVVAGTAFILVMRGGLETLLVVASILAYLAASRTAHLRSSVLWGAAAAFAASAATWFFLQAIISIAPVRPAVVRAIPAVVAVVMLIGFGYWLLLRLDRRRWLEFMSARVFAAAAGGGAAGLFTLTFFVVYRQGFESVAFLQGLLNYTRGVHAWVAIGAAAGLVALAWSAMLVLWLGRRIPLSTLVGISVVLVMAISVALAGNAVRSLQEGYVIPITNLTGSLPRLPAHLAYATGYHPTLETIVAQVSLLAVYVVVALSVLLAWRRPRPSAALAD